MAVIETFRKLEYSDDKKFYVKNDKIELKKYSDDLVFGATFDSTRKAQFSSGGGDPSFSGTQLVNFDAFGFSQSLKLNGSVVYEEENFRTLVSEGTIKFWLRSNFNNAYGFHWFKKDFTPPAVDGVYGVKINNDKVYLGEYYIDVKTNDTAIDITNKLQEKIQGIGVNVYRENNRVRVQSTTFGNEILLEDVEENSLSSLFGGFDKPTIPNGPLEEVEIFNLFETGTNKNRITISHKVDSHFQIKMFDKDGSLIIDEDVGIWSNQPEKFYAIEFGFNQQIGQFYINGNLNKVFMTDGLVRDNCRTYLQLSGLEENNHIIDNLQIYNTHRNSKNFKTDNYPLTPYSAEKPYVDIYFGQGFKENEVVGIITDATSNVHFTVKIGVTWYYYQSSAWRIGDGSFNNSTSRDVFDAKFEELFFNENYELIIRAYFDSDGFTPSYLSEVKIITDSATSSSATITGDVSLLTPVDLTNEKEVIITTEKGSVIVDLTTAAADVSAVTLEEIKQAINDANVPGLAKVMDDGNGKLVLMSTDLGANSVVMITNGYNSDAINIVWGGEKIDTGENGTTSSAIDYSEMFRYVRSRLGAPLVPVELTDEQLEDCLASALYHYNKWRNFKEEIIYTEIVGNARDGYNIPAIVGGGSNIIEIILSLKYPFSYYSGRDDLMANIYFQQIYKQTKNSSFGQNVADYHISLVAQKDYSLILGTDVKWEVLNKKLFIYPQPSLGTAIAIKFKSPLTIDEIINDQGIRDLTLAEAKITLGTIRGTFSGQLPGGDGMIQLDYQSLKSEGIQEKADIIQGWQKSTGGYDILIG